MAAPFFLLILLSALTCFSYIFSWLTYNRQQYWHKLCCMYYWSSPILTNQFENIGLPLTVRQMSIFILQIFHLHYTLCNVCQVHWEEEKIDLFFLEFGNSSDVLSKTFWNLGLVPRAVLAAGWLKEGRRPLIRPAVVCSK